MTLQHDQGLLGRLTDWTGFSPLSDSFKPQHTIEAARRVREKIDGQEAKPPPKYDLEELYKRVCSTWMRTKSLNDLAARDMKRLPWVLYFLPAAQTRARSARMLGEDPEFIRCYGAWLAQASKSAAVRALLYNFLGYYPRGLDTFDSVREILLRELRASRTPSLNRWRTRCSDHGLLDRDGELDFLRSLTRSGETIPSMLDAAGLTGLLARSVFLKRGLLQYLREHAAAVVTERHVTALDRLLEFATVKHHLRFNTTDVRTAIAVSLLEPFEQQSPSVATKERLKRFFLGYYGDPRLANHDAAAGWHGVPESARTVVMRWLAEETLEGFFRIVKETALDRHWKYRNVFWRAYFDRGLIRDAWFALGSKASQLAGQLKLDSAATLSGAGANQSVLILGMSGATVVEWSHNGACRVWLSGHPKAPKSYLSNYYAENFRTDSDFTLSHFGSESGSWQDKLAKWLQDELDVHVPRSAYYPPSGPRW